jgi:hypothetical protein
MVALLVAWWVVLTAGRLVASMADLSVLKLAALTAALLVDLWAVSTVDL